jgi:hypothetical protein
MAALKDDASTDIEAKVTAFAKGISARIKDLLAARPEADRNGVQSIQFKLSKNPISASRTPAEQAQLLVERKTQVCWSAHMADKARHVLCKIDGRTTWKQKDLKKALAKDFETFKQLWGELMRKHGLRNAAGKYGWPSWDQFHLELPESKVRRTDAQACLEEYVRLTREKGEPQNASFEKRYGKLLEPFLDE